MTDLIHLVQKKSQGTSVCRLSLASHLGAYEQEGMGFKKRTRQAGIKYICFLPQEMTIDAGKEAGGQVGRQAAAPFPSYTSTTHRQPGWKLITQEGVCEQKNRQQQERMYACVSMCVWRRSAIAHHFTWLKISHIHIYPNTGFMPHTCLQHFIFLHLLA